MKNIQTTQNEIDLTGLVESYADSYGLDRNLVKAIVLKESSWDPNNENDADPSWGLMGVTQYIGERFGAISSTDDPAAGLKIPEKNLQAGCGYLKYLLGLYPLEDSIEMYNEGEPNFWDGLRVPDYLAAVMENYNGYQAATISS
jgi:soluble lytic murein transglycosylase-like protein